MTIDEILDPAASSSVLADLASQPDLDAHTRAAISIAPAAPIELRRRVLHEALDQRKDGGRYSKRERADFWRELDELVEQVRSTGGNDKQFHAVLALADTMLHRRMPREISDELDLAEDYQRGATAWGVGLITAIALGAIWALVVFASSH